MYITLYKLFLHCYIKISFFLVKEVGMPIENANTRPFKCFNSEEIAKIKNYFQQNKKLKLIIVIIPNSPGTIYSKHIVFLFLLYFNFK